MGKPTIRFEGYTDDWEQRKLGDLVHRVTRKNQDLVSELPLTISAQYGLIDQNKFFDKRVASKDVSGYYLIENGEFAYNKSTSTDAPWGAVKRLDRYENGVLSTLYIVFRIKENNPVDSDFLVSYYSTNLWHKGIHKIATEGARNHGLLNIAPIDFFETKLMIPPYIEEQTKIGKYFEELERLITLHQRKCVETKKFKKFMLQKMFPQKGEKIPEIRFAGFTADWEQRKVGEFLIESRESGHKGDVAHKMTVKLWGKGVYEKNDAGSANTQYFTRHAGQFIYSKLDFLNCAFGVVPEKLEGLETTADVPTFDCDGVNPYFMFYTAIQPSFYEKNGIIADGSRKAKRIHTDTFLNMPFIVPSLEEQNKIVNLLNKLDDLLTLHQHKCEELQNIKKFMLQNMFI